MYNTGIGLLREKGNYKNGEKDGAWIEKSYSCRGVNFNDAVPINGWGTRLCERRKEEGFYTMDKREGLWVLTDNMVEIYSENGKSLQEKIVN